MQKILTKFILMVVPVIKLRIQVYYLNIFKKKKKPTKQNTVGLCRKSPQLGFPGGSADKESTCKVGDLGSIPGLERSPGEGNSYPLRNSGLENFMDNTVHEAAKSWS